MSGHSKWHNIQVKKGKSDKQKANVFTKCARAITIAARTGGGDQTTNFSLRLAVEKAKAVNMPKDNIERAIKRGTGELDDGSVMEEALYEGFGPGGISFMVEAITDNKTRTVGVLKHLFAEYGGTLGGPGSVHWQFNHLGVIRLDAEQSAKIAGKKDEFELQVIDAGAEDFLESEYGIEIRCHVEKFQKVLDVVKTYNLEPASAGLEWVAKEPVAVDNATREKVQRMYDAVEESDDVKSVYTNEA